MPQDQPKTGSDCIAPDCSGMDFYAADRGLRDLLATYLPRDALVQLTPHFQRLGKLAGGRLDELARIADRHPPVLHPRGRQIWRAAGPPRAVAWPVGGSRFAARTLPWLWSNGSRSLPGPFRNALGSSMDRAMALVERVALQGNGSSSRERRDWRGRLRQQWMMRPAL
jgi:hypothetical protein